MPNCRYNEEYLYNVTKRLFESFYEAAFFQGNLSEGLSHELFKLLSGFAI